MEDKWEYVWPIDEEGKRVSIEDFTNVEMVRYQVWQARVECTFNGKRNITEEIVYLNNWFCFFTELTKEGKFDPDSLLYMSLEILRLHKERVGWH